MIRDFIYYDEIKIASYGSQLLEGIVEKITVSNDREKSKDSTTTIEAGANAKLSTEGLISPFISNIINNALDRKSVVFGKSLYIGGSRLI